MSTTTVITPDMSFEERADLAFGVLADIAQALHQKQFSGHLSTGFTPRDAETVAADLSARAGALEKAFFLAQARLAFG